MCLIVVKKYIFFSYFSKKIKDCGVVYSDVLNGPLSSSYKTKRKKLKYLLVQTSHNITILINTTFLEKEIF